MHGGSGVAHMRGGGGARARSCLHFCLAHSVVGAAVVEHVCICFLSKIEKQAERKIF